MRACGMPTFDHRFKIDRTDQFCHSNCSDIDSLRIVSKQPKGVRSWNQVHCNRRDDARAVYLTRSSLAIARSLNNCAPCIFANYLATYSTVSAPHSRNLHDIKAPSLVLQSLYLLVYLAAVFFLTCQILDLLFFWRVACIACTLRLVVHSFWWSVLR